MLRVLLLAKTTGYQTRAFGDAAERLGVDLVYATDRCSVLPDPWEDRAVAVRFDDVPASVAAIVEALGGTPCHGVLAIGDEPAVLAAHVCHVIGLPWHSPDAARAAGNKARTRELLKRANLPTPQFGVTAVTQDVPALAALLRFPCVVKPLSLSGSRGVIRVDDEDGLRAALERLRVLLRASDIRRHRDSVLIEDFVPGREVAVEGIMTHGCLDVLAVFDKPDPLDGPFFEETIYVTPSKTTSDARDSIVTAVGRAARALALRHGPIHAECRLNDRGVFVLEVAARPIGGLCSRALRFSAARDPNGPFCSLEELLLRHAIGESVGSWRRERAASGVMMVPIPSRGVLRQVSGLEEARRVTGVEDIRITAKPDQLLVPLPEGASYLGFIFARAQDRDEVEAALRAAHSHLQFVVDPELRVVQSTDG